MERVIWDIYTVQGGRLWCVYCMSGREETIYFVEVRSLVLRNKGQEDQYQIVDKSMRHQLFSNELVYSSVQLLHHFFMLLS